MVADFEVLADARHPVTPLACGLFGVHPQSLLEEPQPPFLEQQIAQQIGPESLLQQMSPETQSTLPQVGVWPPPGGGVGPPPPAGGGAGGFFFGFGQLARQSFRASRRELNQPT